MWNCAVSGIHICLFQHWMIEVSAVQTSLMLSALMDIQIMLETLIFFPKRYWLFRLTSVMEIRTLKMAWQRFLFGVSSLFGLFFFQHQQYVVGIADCLPLCTTSGLVVQFKVNLVAITFGDSVAVVVMGLLGWQWNCRRLFLNGGLNDLYCLWLTVFFYFLLCSKLFFTIYANATVRAVFVWLFVILWQNTFTTIYFIDNLSSLLHYDFIGYRLDSKHVQKLLRLCEFSIAILDHISVILVQFAFATLSMSLFAFVMDQVRHKSKDKNPVWQMCIVSLVYRKHLRLFQHSFLFSLQTTYFGITIAMIYRPEWLGTGTF